MKRSLHQGALVCWISAVAVPTLPAAQASPNEPSRVVTMHGDIGSSDVEPLPGPGRGAGLAVTKWQPRPYACPTVLLRSDGYPFVLCTNWTTRAPEAMLFDPQRVRPLATYKVNAGNLLGGVYAYLDEYDRMVLVDGQQRLLTLAATQDKDGKWSVDAVQSVSLAQVLDETCPQTPGCGGVVSVSPAGGSDVWFVTKNATIGVYDGLTVTTTTFAKSPGESVHNSFSTTVDGRAAVVSDHALYLLGRSDGGDIGIEWSRDYDRGTARKPGQLSWGSGATPTFFGPDGANYVMLTDNGDTHTEDGPGMSLSALRVSDGELVCHMPLFERSASGTENSAIGLGRSMIVASTYGYPYPAYPDGAGSSTPRNAPFKGGMVRVDINDDDSGCHIVWNNDVRSVAVPKLSAVDGLVYTVHKVDRIWPEFRFVAVDAATGITLDHGTRIRGVLANPLQMAGSIGPGKVYWQGFMSGLGKVGPR